MKIAIVYTSQTGNTEMAAEFIEDGICEISVYQVRSMDIREGEVDVKFLAESDAVILDRRCTYRHELGVETVV
ncbi:MAG: hypothetical protein ACLTNO_08075 [Blautia sp.]